MIITTIFRPWEKSVTVSMSDLRDFDNKNLISTYLSMHSASAHDLVFDRRPVLVNNFFPNSPAFVVEKEDLHEIPYDVSLEGETFTFTRVYDSPHPGYLRMYNRKHEDVPHFSEGFYTHMGVSGDIAPYSIVEADIHYSCNSIARNAFNECKNLKKCVMHDNVSEVKDSAFYACYELEILRLSQNLNRIEYATFNDCKKLQILVIPSTVTTIAEDIFENMERIKILALPESIDRTSLPDDIGTRNSYLDGCLDIMKAKPRDMTDLDWLLQRFQKLPLHKVCYDINVTSQHILQCIRLHPQSTTQQDSAKMTALHIVSMLAMAGHSDVHSVFYALYEADPAALFVQDVWESTPLDYVSKQEHKMSLFVDLIKDLCCRSLEGHIMVKYHLDDQGETMPEVRVPYDLRYTSGIFEILNREDPNPTGPGAALERVYRIHLPDGAWMEWNSQMLERKSFGDLFSFVGTRNILIEGVYRNVV